MERGPAKQHDDNLLFAYWFNDGERRTLQKVAEHFGVSYITVRRYADENDWEGRADSIDEDARRQLDKRLARVIAKTRATEIETMRAVLSKFVRRLTPEVPDENGRMVPNPDYLHNAEVSLRDAIEAGKFLELLFGGATVRVGTDERGAFSAEDLEAEVIDMEARAIARAEARGLPRGEQ